MDGKNNTHTKINTEIYNDGIRWNTLYNTYCATLSTYKQIPKHTNTHKQTRNKK